MQGKQSVIRKWPPASSPVKATSVGYGGKKRGGKEEGCSLFLEHAEEFLLQLVSHRHRRRLAAGCLVPLGDVLVARAAATGVVVRVVLERSDSSVRDQIPIRSDGLLDARVADIGRACCVEEDAGMNGQQVRWRRRVAALIAIRTSLGMQTVWGA